MIITIAQIISRTKVSAVDFLCLSAFLHSHNLPCLSTFLSPCLTSPVAPSLYYYLCVYIQRKKLEIKIYFITFKLPNTISYMKYIAVILILLTFLF